MGWQITGQLPENKKFVIITAPHTSNWDFPMGTLYRFAMGFEPKTMIKREMFRFPFKKLFYALGAIPIDRGKASKLSVVEQMVEHFQKADEFILVVTPEGTRAKARQWKTGFYRIAQGAQVPIVLSHIDYKNKRVGILDHDSVFLPTGDMDADIEHLKGRFKAEWARFPENY